MHPALLLDLDGTLRTTKSGRVAPNSPEDQVVLPGRKEKIQEYKDKGYKIIGISNQGGIAMGHLTYRQCQDTLKALNTELGDPFDQIYVCPDHPQWPSADRKPNPGMIHKAVRQHGIDLSKSLFVGDMSSDQEAAKRAGTEFAWAKDFFKDKK